MQGEEQRKLLRKKSIKAQLCVHLAYIRPQSSLHKNLPNPGLWTLQTVAKAGKSEVCSAVESKKPVCCADNFHDSNRLTVRWSVCVVRRRGQTATPRPRITSTTLPPSMRIKTELSWKVPLPRGENGAECSDYLLIIPGSLISLGL